MQVRVITANLVLYIDRFYAGDLKVVWNLKVVFKQSHLTSDNFIISLKKRLV